MLIRIAWRNIWRKKVRSLVIIMAISLGLWAGIFTSAFVQGMMHQKIENVISMEMSHVQIHEPKFREEFETSLTIKDGLKVLHTAESNSHVHSVSGRVIVMAMISSANSSGSVKLNGIVKEKEAAVTKVHTKIIEGKYFKEKGKNQILIGKKIAEKYKLKVKSKLVITIRDLAGNVTSGAFRVVGIYDTGNGIFDETNVFVRKKDISKLLGMGDELHEIAILLKQEGEVDKLVDSFKSQFPHLEILSWMDLSTGMRYMIEAMSTYTLIIVGIILIALLFSIVNTMLMAVLERIKEIGMLMAIGMSKTKVFSMIMVETIMLTSLGTPIGLLFSELSISYFGHHGINLSNAAYQDMGFSNIIYPTISIQDYANVTIMVSIMAILAAIYPAIKALRLKPVDAIKKK